MICFGPSPELPGTSRYVNLISLTYTQFDCVDLIWPIFSGGSTELNCKSIIARDFIRSLSNWGLVTNWYRVYRVQKNQEKK